MPNTESPALEETRLPEPTSVVVPAHTSLEGTHRETTLAEIRVGAERQDSAGIIRRTKYVGGKPFHQISKDGENWTSDEKKMLIEEKKILQRAIADERDLDRWKEKILRGW